MTYHDYKIYMANRKRLIELKSKGKLVDIPDRVKPVKPCNKIGYLDLIGAC